MSAPLDIPEGFVRACAGCGVLPDSRQMELLGAYLDHLLARNQSMNLTAVREREAAWMRHIFDSLTLLPFLRADPGQLGLDLGSGGGLPGIPLAIMRPDIRWLLVDSVAKKTRFLAETAALLGLENLGVESARAETLGRDSRHRGRYHLLTARAVAPLPVLLEYAAPLLRARGIFYAMKGKTAMEETARARRAARVLGLELRKTHPVPEGGTLLIYKKREETPAAYPRAAGIPAKSPL